MFGLVRERRVIDSIGNVMGRIRIIEVRIGNAGSIVVGETEKCTSDDGSQREKDASDDGDCSKRETACLGGSCLSV